MKYSILIVYMLFVTAVFSQNNERMTQSVEVSFEDFTKGFLCTRLGGWCKEEIHIVSPIEPRNSTNYYGRFFIDNNDSLKLSIEKTGLPIETILVLFKDNKFEVDSILKIPVEVSEKLGLDDNQATILPGAYKIFDSDNREAVIINFGRINTNTMYKENKQTEEQSQEDISPIDNRNEK